MAGIQKEINTGRGDEMRPLTENDLEYWEGPYAYQEFPRAVYRATGPERDDLEIQTVLGQAEWDRLGTAWQGTPDQARAHLRKLDDDVAKAAAESRMQVERMTGKAKAEFLAQEQADELEMTTDVAPRKKPGPKPKAKLVEPA